MEKKEKYKTIAEVSGNVVEFKKYFCFYDRLAKVYGEPFSAKTNAEALRAFHLSLAQQKQKGTILNEDDYSLFCVAYFTTYEDGALEVLPFVEEVLDTEENNKE